MNDLGEHPIGSQDIFTTPSISIRQGEAPYYQGYYNQIKQEFVSARYLYFEGLTAGKPHFSDKDVLLLDTLDRPVYSLAVEKMKMAFRISYSVFDKIAYFLNAYLNLAIPERNVTFRKFWYKDQKKEKGLASYFQKLENWPLRGLFWLSKDLYEYESGFQDAIEPDARELASVRNHLEHKYFKLHNDPWICSQSGAQKSSLTLTDSLAFSMRRQDFEAKTLRLLKTARASLIYLSLGMYCKEVQSANKIPIETTCQIRLPSMKFDDKI